MRGIDVAAEQIVLCPYDDGRGKTTRNAKDGTERYGNSVAEESERGKKTRKKKSLGKRDNGASLVALCVNRMEQWEM